jgi:hypothetical protein
LHVCRMICIVIVSLRMRSTWKWKLPNWYWIINGEKRLRILKKLFLWWNKAWNTIANWWNWRTNITCTPTVCKLPNVVFLSVEMMERIRLGKNCWYTMRRNWRISKPTSLCWKKNRMEMRWLKLLRLLPGLLQTWNWSLIIRQWK